MTQIRKLDRRENNFTIIRFWGAMFVFAGHMGMILGGDPSLVAGFRLHETGVIILFLIGGYLVSQSWALDPNPLRYAIRRFFRFWPPFAVMILITVFVFGPLVSDLGPQGYFASWFTAYLKNLGFYIVYAQPGVFTDLPMAYNTNGSLWTMPVEAVLYVLTPLLCMLLRTRKQTKASFRITLVFTTVLCALDLVLRFGFPQVHPVFYATDWASAFHLMTLYCIGILYTYDEMRQYLNLQAACFAFCIMLVLQLVYEPAQFLVMYILLPYCVFSFALTPRPLFQKFGQKLELSYGIYLYGFLFQQLFTSLQQRNGLNLGYTGIFFFSLAATFVAAALSCVLIEKPCIRLGRYLIGKTKPRAAGN